MCVKMTLGNHFAFALIWAIHLYYPVWIKDVFVNCFNIHLYNSTPLNIAKAEDSLALSLFPNKITLLRPPFAMPPWHSRLISLANEVFLRLRWEAWPWPQRPVKSLLDWLDILSQEDVPVFCCSQSMFLQHLFQLFFIAPLYPHGSVQVLPCSQRVQIYRGYH